MPLLPPAASSLKSLDECRAAINAIDEQIVQLLHQRATVSMAVGRYKKARQIPVLQPNREEELLERLVQEKGPLPENHLRTIYTAILQSSRDLQAGLEA